MLNVGVIGIGNCGNQIASLAHKEVGCDVFAINTSENDLATLAPEIPKKCIGDTQGTGKNRTAAKAFLKQSIMDLIRDEEFKDFINDKDVILIVSSMGGGSGSGMAPIMSEIIRDAFRTKSGDEIITILTGVMPRLNEGLSTQVNALDYMHELFDVLDSPTYMIYDNNNFAKETSYKVLETVNAAVIEDIKVIQCKYNVATPYDSIDEKDMKTLLSSPGRIVISSLLQLKEKDIDELSIEDLLIERIKKSAHAELQRDGIVARTGLITNLSDRLNSQFDTHINSVRKFIGEPTEEFLHIAVNEDKALPNNVCLVLTGLSKITDRVDKIRERISEIESQQREKESEVDDASIDSDEIARLNGKRNYRESKKQDETVNLENIFNRFNA